MLLPVPTRSRKRGGKEMIRFAAEEYQEMDSEKDPGGLFLG